jgi:hypothetical protein
MWKQRVQCVLLSVVTISGTAVALRMLLGPLDAPARVRTPLNPAGWFGVALAAFLATSAVPSREHWRGRQPRWQTVTLIASLTALTVIAFRSALFLYFLSDDFILVTLARTVALRQWFTTAGGDGFFRPIGYLSLALTSMWAGVNPVAWHATAVALHAANVVLVFLLSTRLPLSRLASAFAAALFAIHGTRPEAVVWIAGRFDLVATLFLLGGLLFFARSCPAASLICMALAILGKESAYIFPLLLLLFLVAKGDLSRRWIGSLTLFFATAAALFAYRWWLCGGIGGYRDTQTGEPQALTVGPATVKALGLRMWTALFFPINWSTEPHVWLTALLLGYIGALAWFVRSHPDRTLIAWALGFAAVSALPALPLLAIGADLSNSRVLYLPSVGFCWLLAAAIDGLSGRFRWAIAAVIFAFHFAALGHNLDAWEYASRKAKSACVAPAEGITPPGSLLGVPFFANGFPECIELQRNTGATGNGQRRPAPRPGDRPGSELGREQPPAHPPRTMVDGFWRFSGVNWHR